MRAPDVKTRMVWASGILRWGAFFAIVAYIIFRIYGDIVTPAPYISPAVIPVPQPDRTEVTLKLVRGNFMVHRYVPGQAEFAAHPKAVIIFGSGDGGFDGWEDRVCKALQADGCEMIGFDCNAYAKTDYDLLTLQTDMNTIAQSLIAQDGTPSPPLIIGGWSMGAEQAVPAGGGPNRPAGLVGLLLISPGSRGRYGLRDADRWDVPPTGPGTFAMQDFAGSLDGLRVAQWDGNLDLIGSTKWLTAVSATHKAYSFNYGFHDYDGASDKFLIALKKSIAWILSQPEESEH